METPLSACKTMLAEYTITPLQREALAAKYSLRCAARGLETKLHGLDIEAVIGLEIEGLTKTARGWLVAVSLTYRLAHNEASAPAEGRVILREEGLAIEIALAGAMAGASEAVLGHVRLLNGRAA
ncbi:hypothetical protein EN821_09790 [Mesorhizobium sp. M2D.F.Ca.ET.178.01.1.1]|nr:hypothetical protein EN821_09790 [Mesorhizobium sp. M2D.F.Ca.ET.178.01.1.1]